MKSGLSASPAFSMENIDRIERRDYSKRELTSIRGKITEPNTGITPTSLLRSERTPLDVLSAKGGNKRIVAAIRLLSLADETKFTGDCLPDD